MRPALSRARIDRAIGAAAALCDVTAAAVRGRSRSPIVCAARLAVYHALYTQCQTSYPEVGRALGRDHTTVIYGVDRAASLARIDQDYAALLEMIAGEIH